MIVTPATLRDVRALYAGLGIETPRASEYQALLAQMALGHAWAFRSEGSAESSAPPNALAGILIGPESVIWFRSGANAHRVMPGLVSAFRALIRIVARSAPGPVVTYEQPDNPTGRRIARALGFRDSGRRICGGVEIWEWSDGSGGVGSRGAAPR